MKIWKKLRSRLKCKLKSAIILKDRFLSLTMTVHYTDMFKELGIEDSRKNAETLVQSGTIAQKW